MLAFFCIPHTFLSNACYGCENAENRTLSEFFHDRRKFRRQCVNVIQKVVFIFYVLKISDENSGLGVQ